MAALSALSNGQNQIPQAQALMPSAEIIGPGRARAPGDHPDQMARRLVRLSYGPMTSNEQRALLLRLQNAGLFDYVGLQTAAVTTALQGPVDELTLNNTTDPHHKQYAFGQLNLVAAQDRTRGRVLLGAVDSGLNPNEPELTHALRPQFSAFSQVTGQGIFVSNFLPGDLNPADLFTAHGLLVSGVMVSRLDSNTSALPNSGTVGVCPSCSFSMIRLQRFNDPLTEEGQPSLSMANAYTQLTRAGAAVINHSGSTGTKSLADVVQVKTAIGQAISRDIAVVAAAGNQGAIGPIQGLVPADEPMVYSIGATDQHKRAWNEWNMRKNYALQDIGPHIQRLPVLGDASGLNDGRCGAQDGLSYSPIQPPSGTSECGSNLNSNIAFMAPGAQVLGLVDRTVIPLGTLNPSPSCQPPANCSQGAPFAPNLGSLPVTSSDYSVNRAFVNTSYATRFGAGSGTSFAAPHISGIIGLLRSVNPLLRTKIASDPVSGGPLGEALSFNVTAPVADAQTVTGCGVAGRCGAGIPNAASAIDKALGTIAGAPLNNRLTPAFQLKQDAQAVAQGGEEEEGVVSPEAWLTTTSPQVAMAALDSRLYYTGPDDSNNDFGTDMLQPYKAGFEPPGSTQTHVMPASQYRHRLFGTSPGTAQLPFASFYLFTTENGPQGSLAPLYRMSSKCFSIRKHFYTTSAATRDLYATGPETSSQNIADCITGSLNTDRGYFYDGVEGYVLTTQAPGTVALRIGYKSAGVNSGWAIFTEAEISRFPDYVLNSDPLGYVYPAVTWANGQATYNDTDADGLSDAFEQAMKLNEQAADSDCDGSPDGVEFPIAGISPSDPMSSSNCADLRLRKTVTPLSYHMSNPIGPSAAQNPTLELTYSGSTIGGSFTLVAPTAPGWTCAPGSVTYLPQNSFTATRICSGPSSLAVSPTEVVFSFPVGGSAPVGTTYLPISAQAKTTSTDPVPANNLTN